MTRGLFLADTGCRIGEALGLYWSDVDLQAGVVRIQRSRSRGRLGPTKTGRSRTVELSARLGAVLAELQPDVFGEAAPVCRALDERDSAMFFRFEVAE